MKVQALALFAGVNLSSLYLLFLYLFSLTLPGKTKNTPQQTLIR